MDIASTIFYILALVVLILRFTSRKGGHWYTTSFLFLLGTYSSILLIYHTLRGGAHVSYAFALVPLPTQVLFIIFFIIYLNDAINKKNIETYISHTFTSVGLSVVGLGYIASAFIFGYSYIQCVTGLMTLGLAASFLLTGRYSSYRAFRTTAVVAGIVLSAYYLLMIYFEIGEVKFDSVRYIILKYSGGILFLLLLIALNLKQKGLFSEKKFKIIAKLSICLVIAAFISRHPEIDVKGFPILKDVFQYTILSGNLGLLGYCTIAVAKGGRYLI